MHSLRPIRSALFVPGVRPDRFAKALATSADAVIIDLEDAVPPEKKEEARANLRLFLEAETQARVIVRTNGVESPHFPQDITCLAGMPVMALIIPKVEKPGDLEAADQVLGRAEADIAAKTSALPVIPLIETAAGVENVASIASWKTEPVRLLTMAFGAADYTLDLGIEMTYEGSELLYARSRLPIACRSAGLAPPLDTPFMLDLKDQQSLRADALRAKQLGFQGKLCVHPDQVETVNQVFSPTPAEIEKAEKIVQAFETAEASGQGAVQIGGTFIDYPVVQRARRTLELAILTPGQTNS